MNVERSKVLRRRVRRVGRVALGAALLAAFCTVPRPVASADDAPLVARGTVALQDNATKATIGKAPTDTNPVKGARVSLLMSTDPHATADKSDYRTVASAITEATGAYDLHLAPAADIEQQAAGNDGWVNFMMVTQLPNGDMQVNHISRALVDDKWTDKGRPDFAPGRPITATIAHDSTGRPLNAFHTPATNAVTTKDIQPAACGVFTVYSRWTASTRIGNFHNTHGSKGTWGYGTTADSDIDVGVQASDGTGV